MKRDVVFQSSGRRRGDFEFDAEVAEVFDDMTTRSVPFYAEQQDMIKSIAGHFWRAGTTVYDLGCSTATTLIGLAADLPDDARLVGYDNSVPMLDWARAKLAANGFEHRIDLRAGDLNANLNALPLDNASLVTMCWTLQFIRPLRRGDLLRRIYESLVDGGALIVCEKILLNDGDVNRFFIDYYYEHKYRQGYSEAEVVRKREALENVLIPYRLEENLELFRRSGFQIVETFFQWFNFAGFLCVKKSGAA